MRISDWSSDVCSSDLEMNPDMLVGGAAKANAAAATGEPEDASADIRTPAAGVRRTSLPSKPAMLSLAGLPRAAALVWGNKAAPDTVTVFHAFRCGYCRPLTAVLRSMHVRLVERPNSVLGRREVGIGSGWEG